MSGQEAVRANITAISVATQCEITVTEEDVYSTGDYVRVTDLGGNMPVKRGMEQINNGLYKVEKTSATTYLIKNIITDENINSLSFTPYVTNGRLNLNQTQFIYEGES